MLPPPQVQATEANKASTEPPDGDSNQGNGEFASLEEEYEHHVNFMKKEFNEYYRPTFERTIDDLKESIKSTREGTAPGGKFAELRGLRSRLSREEKAMDKHLTNMSLEARLMVKDGIQCMRYAPN